VDKRRAEDTSKSFFSFAENETDEKTGNGEYTIYIYIYIYMYTETVGWWGGDSKGRYGMAVCARRGTSCVLTWLWFHGCLVTRMSSTHARAWVCVGLCVLHKTETARLTLEGGRGLTVVSAEVYNIIVQSTTVAVVVQWKIFFVVAICRHPSSLGKSPPSAHSTLTSPWAHRTGTLLLISTIIISC